MKIEVGKYYRIENIEESEKLYFKVITIAEDRCFCKHFTINNSGISIEANKAVMIYKKGYDELTEIPENEYKSKLKEAKQVLEELE